MKKTINIEKFLEECDALTNSLRQDGFERAKVEPDDTERYRIWADVLDDVYAAQMAKVFVRRFSEIGKLDMDDIFN